MNFIPFPVGHHQSGGHHAVGHRDHRGADRRGGAGDRRHRADRVPDDGAQQARHTRHLQPERAGVLQSAAGDGQCAQAAARGAANLSGAQSAAAALYHIAISATIICDMRD